ncbi:hypothetical protein Tco_1309847 [Tanacetum coccineum]
MAYIIGSTILSGAYFRILEAKWSLCYAAPVVETTLVASPTELCGLIPYSDSDSDSPDEMSSSEHISPLTAMIAILPFYALIPSEALILLF